MSEWPDYASPGTVWEPTRETGSWATHQGTLICSHLSSLSHCESTSLSDQPNQKQNKIGKNQHCTCMSMFDAQTSGHIYSVSIITCLLSVRIYPASQIALEEDSKKLDW